jgi:uncharacterized ferritin-like protein (DUF455 family)
MKKKIQIPAHWYRQERSFRRMDREIKFRELIRRNKYSVLPPIPHSKDLPF